MTRDDRQIAKVGDYALVLRKEYCEDKAYFTYYYLGKIIEQDGKLIVDYKKEQERVEDIEKGKLEIKGNEKDFPELEEDVGRKYSHLTILELMIKMERLNQKK